MELITEGILFSACSWSSLKPVLVVGTEQMRPVFGAEHLIKADGFIWYQLTKPDIFLFMAFRLLFHCLFPFYPSFAKNCLFKFNIFKIYIEFAFF